MEEAEALYRDFASQPHKTNEVEVFAAYYVMRALLEGDDEDLWWECLRETEERGYDNDAVFAAVSRLEKEFRDDDGAGVNDGRRMRTKARVLQNPHTVSSPDSRRSPRRPEQAIQGAGGRRFRSIPLG